jgi:site-specific DNA-methyltransferase (cytosine-N4-specific)
MDILLRNGAKAKLCPSAHHISTKFNSRPKGAIPPNLLQIANTESNSRYLRACRQTGLKPHPARYPAGLPEFFIRMLTDEGDLVVDPFAGSNVTGEVCERLKRRWIAVDVVEEYLEGSKFRFDEFCMGDWVEHGGQRSFFLREDNKKYPEVSTAKKKGRKPRSG